MSRQWDALVIGAGPAGLRAASVIAESGLEVVLVDEQAFPGGQIYRAAMPFADVLEVTVLDLDVPGDTVAPEIDPEAFVLAWSSDWRTSVGGVRYRHDRYTRRSNAERVV